MAWWVLHVDLDQFLVAVEVLRRPDLRGRPVVVGGSGDPTAARVVVESASYEARAAGVRAGMPLRLAARRCPETVFLASDRPTYEAVSARVMATLRALPVVVEVLGWDEAFIGARTDDPETLAGQMQHDIGEMTGLECTVGIGDTRLRAKLATGFGKPAGIYRLTARNWVEVMADRPTEALWGIGGKTARALAAAGYQTVGELAAADRQALAQRFGPTMGPWYRLLARGGGDAHVVDAPRVARSRSREITFAADLVDGADIAAQVTRLASELTTEIVEAGRLVTRVAVKVRSASFFTRTKIVKLAAPTNDPDVVLGAALALLNGFELDRPVRLVGVRVELAEPPDASANLATQAAPRPATQQGIGGTARSRFGRSGARG